MRAGARLDAAEQAARRVTADRLERLARRAIESAEEAVELILAVEREPDRNERARAIRDRLTDEARTALRVIFEAAIAAAEAREARTGLSRDHGR